MSPQRDDSAVYKLDRNMSPLEGSDVTLQWHDPREAPFRLSGFAWFHQDRLYRRLPLHPADPLPEAVDSLANCTAGGQIGFQTTSSRIAVRVALTGRAGMPHMPSTGQCGFDLYLGAPGEQRFRNVAKYDHSQDRYELQLFAGPEEDADPNLRNVLLNFPLYMGVQDVLVGLDPDAEVSPPPDRAAPGPVVVYGTSITQGGCAARPGMAYTNILSRRLNLEFVNLGFSGNGRGEPEVARAIATVKNPRLLVLDYEANADGRLRDTLPGFVDILRHAHPDVPILVVSRIRYAGELTHPGEAHAAADRRAFQAEVVEERRSNGDRAIDFIDGSTLLGNDFDECTVDGSHPTDLGFWRMAQGLEPALRKWALP